MASILDELSSVLDNVPPRYSDVAAEYRIPLSKHSTELQTHVKRDDIEFTTADGVAKAVQIFPILFGDSVILPDDLTESTISYQDMQRRSWAVNCWLPAACFVTLKNAVEVALALLVIQFFSATFAIRGIGHNANPGFSSIDGGILRDIRALNSIDLAADKATVSVGPGATWSAVYEELKTRNLTVPEK
ncbi:uncharacterized protein Z518_11240 [Rhinocladiella mackenziei CBS 650.93]|uniref:FAD linked oxidase N-terminal domain-containing protein n=1 Tax=Rhinocladiella mackenziei CBS 650.93 TaxID=1442369 RepID=A0A0D2FBQ5_9EURO|nr:uncharacterized protein Z518_11240 [Rhinocladiella mackenziei CBS 650.93]KIW99501.1 hypothetical protein Z518_11240 [Rhinocladiella mackenziei CBS 650.93]